MPAVTSQTLADLRDQCHPAAYPAVDKMADYLDSGDPAVLPALSELDSGCNVYRILADMVQGMEPPYSEMDRRTIAVLSVSPGAAGLAAYLTRAALKPSGVQAIAECWDVARSRMDRATFLGSLARQTSRYSQRQSPNFIGQAMLDSSDEDLRGALTFARKSRYPENAAEVTSRLLAFLLTHAPGRVTAFVDAVLSQDKENPTWGVSEHARALMAADPELYEAPVAACVDALDWRLERIMIARALHTAHPGKYGGLALTEARNYLRNFDQMSRGSAPERAPLLAWLVAACGPEVGPDLADFMAHREGLHGRPRHELADFRQTDLRVLALDAAARAWGREAIPVCLAAVETSQSAPVVLAAVGHLVKLDAREHRDLILGQIRDGLERFARDWLELAEAFDPSAVEDLLWVCLTNAQTALAAARVLARLGAPLLPKLDTLLADENVSPRVRAVFVLANLGGPEAERRLNERLEQESDEDVRDLALATLARVWKAAGRQFSRAEVLAWIGRSAGQLAATWVDWGRLPELFWSDGTALNETGRTYLCYRQSRALGVAMDPEAAVLLTHLDRSRAHGFAMSLLEQFLAAGAPAKDRWPVALSACLGDDPCLELLISQIPPWADAKRIKLAEAGISALALNGSVRALRALDRFSRLYSSKNPSLGRAAVEAYTDAARQEGVTPEELGDRIVPWLGFAAGQKRVQEGIEIRISAELKLEYLDPAKAKLSGTLPKTASASLKQEMKELAVHLKEAVQSQLARLETMMVLQHRWGQEGWRGLFLGHPLLARLTARLVWIAGGQTFVVTEDGTLGDAQDDPVSLPTAVPVGIAHPLELPADLRSAWRSYFADHRLVPAFAQMERLVLTKDPGLNDQVRLRDWNAVKMAGVTYRSRAEKLGWRRGASDGASVQSYLKRFPSAALEAHLVLDGMYYGIGPDGEISLGDLWLARAGSFSLEPYGGDVPSHDADPRLVKVGLVPDVVYSELRYDMQRITGAAGEE